MKHDVRIVIVIISFFFISQLIGLAIADSYIDKEHSTFATIQKGEIITNPEIEWKPLPYNLERPQVDESFSYIFILSAVLIGTLFILFIMYLGKEFIWKIWFFAAVWLTLTLSFNAFVKPIFAGILSLLLAIFKVLRPNIYIHNLTELVMYGGLAVIFIPILNMFSVSMLLLGISIYDIWAVNKSKHMIRLAKFQSNAKVFAGLSIPYNPQIEEMTQKIKLKTKTTKTAMLGGGDIGFPLLFTGTVLKYYGLTNALVIPLFTTAALAYLFIKAKKDKFYPAMPILTIGCFAGYLAMYASLRFL